MKKYIIALFIIAFSTLGVNYVVNTASHSRTQLSLDNVEALACTLISENGPTGGWIWCVCTYNYVCHVTPSKNETIYGYAQER